MTDSKAIQEFRQIILGAVSRGRAQWGLEELERRLKLEPRSKETWRLYGEFGEQVSRPDLSARGFSAVLGLDDYDTHARIHLGLALVKLGQRVEALEAAHRASNPLPEFPELLDCLGTLYTWCEEASSALPLFLEAVSRAPGNPSYLYNLATSQRMNGELAAAEATLNRVIALRRDDVDAYHVRSSLRAQTPSDNHIAEIKSALSRGAGGTEGEIRLCYAAAKELEDIGRYDESFEYLSRGARLMRSRLQYDVAGDIQTIDHIIATHSAAALLAPGGGFETREPIFVMGLPRSGTTLVERIIGSHSDVFAAEELPAFPQVTVRAVQERVGRPVSKIEFVAQCLAVDPSALGKAYLAATRPQTGHTPHFIDKLPLNYLYLGLIARALPQARIVSLRRHPLDSCYAMYKMLFTSAYPFSYDLTDLGRYYAAWQRLMQHWQGVLGERLLIVDYEELVNSQESVTRRMLEHCGVLWEEGCLRYYDQKNAVTTASASQVRQPIYRSSLGRWRAFENQLAPLIETLKREGVDVAV